MIGQINTDRPIESREQDEFNRVNFAKSLSVQLKNAPEDDSLVAALLGPWGSGKSSILNLVENCIANELTILRFNPWYFSGTEDLVEQFFREISAQLKSKSDNVLESIGDSLIKYCGLLKPMSIIPFLGEGLKEVAGVGEIVGSLLTSQRDSLKISLYDQKKHIQNELKKVDKKIVVFIDDIDRLAPDEVKELFRLIRLVADFPNIVYFLSFDRARIERYLSIGQDEQFGKEYLEKIYQISYDVPCIHQEELGKFFTQEVDKHIKDLKVGPFNSGDWSSYYHYGILNMLKTPRDVRRIVNVLPMVLSVVEDEVALEDVVAIETIRVLYPSAYRKIISNFNLMTSPTDRISSLGAPGQDDKKEEKRKILSDIFNEARDQSESLKNLIEYLFPTVRSYVANYSYGYSNVKDWRKKRKVASGEVFRTYLEKSLPKGFLPASLIKDVYENLGNTKSLNQIFEKLSKEDFVSLLSRLEDYEHDFPKECVVNAAVAILNNSKELDDITHDFFATSKSLQVGRVIYRLFLKDQNEERLLRSVKSILEQTETLSWKMEVILIVGHRENVGHSLIDESDTAKLEEYLVNELLNTDAIGLRGEVKLSQLLWLLNERAPEKLEMFIKENIYSDLDCFIRLLRSFLWKYHSTSQKTETPEVDRYRLSWRSLIKYIPEDKIRKKIESSEVEERYDSLDSLDQIAIDVTRKYLDGTLWEQEDTIDDEL